MAEQQDKVFNEQAFLLDFYDKTVEGNQFIYDNFIQLEGRSAGIVNKILAKGNPNVLWDLNQAQLAMLVPKIAIYKVQKNTAKAVKGKRAPSKTIERRFVFDDHTDVRSMLKETNRGRGDDAGLVSFSWTDQGTDPGNSGLSFEATLKLKFASFDGIFKIRDNGLSFAELLVPPGVLSTDLKKRRSTIDSKIATTSGRREIDPSEFQIKAIVGWQVPSDPKKLVFRGDVNIGTGEHAIHAAGTLASSLRSTQVAFLLTLTGHDIDIKEDGAIDLTINYQASMEGYMMTPKMDLLKIDYSGLKAEAAAVDIAGGVTPKASVAEALETLDEWKKKTAVNPDTGKMSGRYEKFVQQMIDNKDGVWKNFGLTSSERQWIQRGGLPGMQRGKVGGASGDTYKTREDKEKAIRRVFAQLVKDRDVSELKNVEVAKEQVKYEKNKLEAAKKDLRSEAYARLLCAIDNRAKSRLFYITLNQTQIELYKDMYDDYHTKGEGATNAASLLKFRKKMRRRINNTSDVKSNVGGKEVSMVTPQKSSVSSEEYLARVELNQKLVAAAGDEDAKKEAMKWYKDRKKPTWEKIKDGVGEFFGYSSDSPETASPPYILNFFYFGDLVSAALKVLSSYDVYKKKNIQPEVPTYKDFRFMLGTIDVYNPTTDSIESVPLADIPISSMLFQNWFRKNIIEKDIIKLPLLTFLRQIATQLIVGALKSMRSYRPAEGPLNTKLSISSFLLHKSRLNSVGGRIVTDNIGKAKGTKADPANSGIAFSDISQLRQYYFMYIGGTLNRRLKGNEWKDREQGIFHAFLGKQDGIIKRVSFKRTDLPFQREARMADAPGDSRSNLLFSDWYNAEITMVGNSVFRPGMLLFIDPTATGYGMHVANTIGKISMSRASQLGIGGYYLITKVENTIESGKYETNLELVAEAPMFSLKEVGRTGYNFAAERKKRKRREDRKAKRAQRKKDKEDAARKKCIDQGAGGEACTDLESQAIDRLKTKKGKEAAEKASVKSGLVIAGAKGNPQKDVFATMAGLKQGMPFEKTQAYQQILKQSGKKAADAAAAENRRSFNADK